MSFLPQYLVAVKHFSSADMGLIMTCFGAGGIFWGIALPWLSDKLGRKPVLALASLMSIVLPLGLIFSGNVISHVIAFVVAGSPVLGALPIALTIIPSESIPRAFVAQTIGLVVGLAELTGGFIAPALAGVAADKFGLPAVFYIAAGAVFTASIFTCCLIETSPVLLNKKKKASA
jgi:sugar phosphate permease